MADTTFVAQTTKILAAWLNAANSAVYRANSGITGITSAMYRTALVKFADVISVKDFGALGDGTTDDAPAFILAIAAASGKSLFIPDPTSYYKLGSGLGTIPANTRLYGVNKRTAKIQRAFSGTQVLTLADGASLDNIYLEGDGANYSGKGVVIAGTDGNQNVTNCRIINFDGNCVEFTATTAGSRSNWDNIEAWQTNGSTGSAKYAFVNADGAQAAAVPKAFHHIETSGFCSFSFGGSNDVFVSSSFLGDIAYTANSKAVHLAVSRLANQSALSILGDNNTIVGCTLYPNITLSGVGPYALQGNTYNGTVTDSSSNMNNVVDAPSVSYTPTWTGSVADPVIGNGTLRGEYTRNGDTIHLTIEMIAGGTTTFGTGVFRFSVPVVPVPLSGSTQIGFAYFLDSTTTTAFGSAILASAGTYLTLASSATLTGVGTASPWTWAVNDIIRISIVYQL